MIKNKKKLIIVLTVILVVMCAGFAAFIQVLNLGSSADIASKWEIYISKIETYSVNGDATDYEGKIFSDRVSGSVQADLVNPGDFVEYKVTVTNAGTIDAVLNQINLKPRNQSKYISFSSTAEVDKVLKAGASTAFLVKIEFNNTTGASDLTDEVNSLVDMELVYNQKGVPKEGEDEPPVVVEPTFSINEEGIIIGYNYEYGNTVVIPDVIDGIEVKGINASSFADDGVHTLQSLDLSNCKHLEYIDDDAFNGYTSLTQVKLPKTNGNLIIGERAFYNCRLTEIEIPETVTEIGDNAFKSNNIASIDDVTIKYDEEHTATRFDARWSDIGFPGTPTNTIVYNNFVVDKNNPNKIIDYNLDGTTEVVIPDSINGVRITEIDENAFKNKGLTKVTIGKNVTNIPDGSFTGNNFDSLDDIIIKYTEDNVPARFNEDWTDIGFPGTPLDYVESGCFYVDGFEPTTIIDYKYVGCPSDVVIPSKINDVYVYKIGPAVFYDLDYERIKTITEKANRFKITSLTFENTNENPSHLKSIGTSAFANQNFNSSSIIIPASVEKIESNVFLWSGVGGVTFENTETKPSNLKDIGAYAFAWNNLKDVNLPSSVEKIEEFAFTTTGITSFNIENTEAKPSHLKTIEYRAFYSTTNSFNAIYPNSFSSIIIPASVTFIGESAFYSCGLSNIVFEDTSSKPSNLTTIEYDAFENTLYTGKIQNITIPASVTSIGNGAFSGRFVSGASAADVTIKSNRNNAASRFDENWSNIGFPGLRSIKKEGCFYTDTSGLGIILKYDTSCGTSVTIPEQINGITITTIGENAFKEELLQKIVFPNTITEIKENAFMNATVGEIVLNDGLRTIGQSAFYEVKAGNIIFGDNIESIGINAFRNSAANKIVLNEGLKTINNSAFYDAQVKEPMIIPSTVTTIDHYAFYNSNVSSFTFKNNMTLGDNAFELCNLQSLTIEEGVTEIPRYCFKDNNIKILTIPKSVEMIDSYAFQNNKIETLVLSGADDDTSQLTSIKSYAFNKNKISSVTIPLKVTEISSGAFTYNNFRKNGDITLKYDNTYKITRIGQNYWNSAFCRTNFGTIPDCHAPLGISYGCFAVSETSPDTIVDYNYNGTCRSDVEIPSQINNVTITTIGENAFTYSKPSSVIIPNTITTIKKQAFAGSDLESIKIPYSVTSIGYEAFYNNKIHTLEFEDTEEHPSQLALIDNYAFQNNFISSLTIPASVTTIKNYSFNSNAFTNSNDILVKSNATNKATRFNENWTTIGFPGIGPGGEKVGCFYIHESYPDEIVGYDEKNCSSDVVIPDQINGNTITTIGFDAFKDKEITSVVLPDTLETISTSAFYNNNLSEVIIPASVKTISTTAFGGNNFEKSSDITVLYNDTNQVNRFSTWTSIGFPGGGVNSIGCFEASNGVITDYKTNCATDYVDIPSEIDGVTTTEIGNSAFNNLSTSAKIEHITIPNTVTIIGTSAFRSNLIESVTLPSNLTTLGNYSFTDNKLKSIEIPNSVTNIGNYVFQNNELTSVTLPTALISIGTYAFNNNKLKSVEIPNSVTSIGNYAFRGNELTTVNLSTNLTTLGTDAFRDNFLESITLPLGISKIPVRAFQNNKLTTIDIPEGVTSIGSAAFQENNLTSVEIPSTVTTIGTRVFSINKISNVTVGGGADRFTFDEWITSGLPADLSPNAVYSGCYIYEDSSTTTVYINGYDRTCGKDLVIPDKINDKNVDIYAYSFTNYDIDSITFTSNNDISIGTYAFYKTGVSSVNLPTTSGITVKLNTYAFANNNLTNLYIPNNVSTIPGNAFSNNKITELTFQNDVGARAKITSLPGNSFSNNNLTSLTLPASIRTLSADSFTGNNITSATIGYNATSISGRFGSTTLTNAGLPSVVTWVEEID